MSILKEAAAKIKAASKPYERRIEARVAARLKGVTPVLVPARLTVKTGTTIYTSACKSSKR